MKKKIGCTIMCIYIALLNCTLKIVGDDKCYSMHFATIWEKATVFSSSHIFVELCPLWGHPLSHLCKGIRERTVTKGTCFTMAFWINFEKQSVVIIRKSKDKIMSQRLYTNVKKHKW